MNIVNLDDCPQDVQLTFYRKALQDATSDMQTLRAILEKVHDELYPHGKNYELVLDALAITGEYMTDDDSKQDSG